MKAILSYYNGQGAFEKNEKIDDEFSSQMTLNELRKVVLHLYNNDKLSKDVSTPRNDYMFVVSFPGESVIPPIIIPKEEVAACHKPQE